MKFDLPLMRRSIGARRDQLAQAYGIAQPADDPSTFVDQVVEALEQPAVADVLSQRLDDTTVFRSAVRAIGSSSTNWTVYLRREPALTQVLNGFDPHATAAALRDGVLTVDSIRSQIPGQYPNGRARAIANWALLLDDPHGWYEIVKDVSHQFCGSSSRSVGG